MKKEKLRGFLICGTGFFQSHVQIYKIDANNLY